MAIKKAGVADPKTFKAELDKKSAEKLKSWLLESLEESPHEEERVACFDMNSYTINAIEEVLQMFEKANWVVLRKEEYQFTYKVTSAMPQKPGDYKVQLNDGKWKDIA